MTGEGKYREFKGVEDSGGSCSLNKLRNNCYFLRNSDPVLLKDFRLLLSNPNLGPASALAPPTTPPCAAPVDNMDKVPPQLSTNSGPASALAPPITLPCAAPVINMDMVPPPTSTTKGHADASTHSSTPPCVAPVETMAPVVSAPTTTRPTSPTSVILDPLVGSWVPYNLKPAARTRATAISLSVAPLSSRFTLNPMAKPWNRPLTTPLAVPSDHSLHSTIQPQGKTDPLLHAAAVAVNELQSFDSLSAFIRSRQQPTLAAPPLADHPAAALLTSYAFDGLPANVGPSWTIASIDAGIAKGPHTSAVSPTSTLFCRQELLERSQRGFSIILSVPDALRFFGRKLRISRLACLDQKNRKPRLICNSSEAPDNHTPSVNDTTDTSSNPMAMQFGSCLPRLLQKLWEANPLDGPVFLSKWDISDAFHRCPIRPEDVGAFSYVVPPLPTDPHQLLCIDLVLPMGWVNSPDLFCASSETVTDLANTAFRSELDPAPYQPTADLYTATPSPSAGPHRLQYADVYMDDINCLTQGDVHQQRRVTEIVLDKLKLVYPTVKGELKDSISLKKARAGDGNWQTSKEILGWIIDSNTGTISLSEKRIQDLDMLLRIPASQHRMSRKKLERLIGKLRSMHLAIPGAIGHFYHIQMALTKANRRTAYLSKDFHNDIAHWRLLCSRMKHRPTYLAEIVQRLPTDIGYTDASGLGGGGVWLNPNADGVHHVWRLPWPADIKADLVSLDNPSGHITNSDLELAALVLHEATFTTICNSSAWRAPLTGSDNTPTVAWTFKEAATINPVVANLLRIRSIVNSNSSITPAVFYHPGVLNTMADDASRLFHLTNPSFLSSFSRKYNPEQSPSSWTICQPPQEVISCVISALRRQRSEEVTYPILVPPPSTGNGNPSAPTSMWTTNYETLTHQPSNSFKCLDTGFVTDTTPCNLVSGQTRLQRRGELSPRPTYWKAYPTHASALAPPPKSSTRDCQGWRAITPWRTRPPNVKRLSP